MATRTPYILTDAGRYADMMKQGFMKPLPVQRKRKDGKAVGTPPPMVSCCGCLNWHRKGAHILKDAGQRKANLAKTRATDLLLWRFDPATQPLRPMEEE